MQLNDIKLFIWTAQLQSFTLAGKHFDMPRQTVSRRISTLEEQLGVRLLQRTTRRIELTELGQEFLNRWQRILEEIDYTQQVISDRQSKPKGKVTIAGPNEFGRILFGHWLPELTERFPELDIRLHSTEGTGQHPELNVDLLVHVGRPKDTSFVGFKLGTVCRKFYASPEFIARHGKPSHPSELVNYPCVLNPVMGEPEDIWQWRDGHSTHEIRVRGRLGADTTSFAQTMAERSIGIAWLPEFMTWDALKQGRLVSLFDGQYETSIEIYVLYASRTFIPAKTRVVIEFIKEKLLDKLDLRIRAVL